MRLVLLINSLGAGGAERSIAELLPYLVADGIRPTICLLGRRRKGVESQVLAEGYDVRFLDGSRMPGRVIELRRQLRRIRPDLLHTSIFEADVVGRLGAAGPRVPVLSSLVNTSYAGVRLRDPRVRKLGLRMARSIDGWTARHLTERFHALSNAVKVAAVRDLGIDPDRVTVIPRGRDPHRLGEPSIERKGSVRRRLGLRAEDEVLINVGRQEFQKGQQVLLEAAAELARSRPNLVVLMVGREGHVSGELQATTGRLGLTGRVRFLGHRDDVPDLLAASDVFIFPSLYEGFGGALVEAMALGLPVVASDLDSLREVVVAGESALLVPPGSPASLAMAVAELLESPGRRTALGKRGRALFSERYRIDVVARRMIDLFRSVAIGPAREPSAEPGGSTA